MPPTIYEQLITQSDPGSTHRRPETRIVSPSSLQSQELEGLMDTLRRERPAFARWLDRSRLFKRRGGKIPAAVSVLPTGPQASFRPTGPVQTKPYPPGVLGTLAESFRSYLDSADASAQREHRGPLAIEGLRFQVPTINPSNGFVVGSFRGLADLDAERAPSVWLVGDAIPRERKSRFR